MENRKRNAWTVVKEFRDDDAGLVVQVTSLAGARAQDKPLYSLVVGSVVRGAFAPFINPLATIQNAVVSVIVDGMKLARLYDNAMLCIQERMQLREDEEIMRRQLRETKAIARETGVEDTVKTGKTEREAGKRARHESNLAARRAQDQERTSKTKGK